MRRVLREHEEGHGRRFYRAARPPQLKIWSFQEKKIIVAKSGNILPYFKVNLSDSQTPFKGNVEKYIKIVCTFLTANNLSPKAPVLLELAKVNSIRVYFHLTQIPPTNHPLLSVGHPVWPRSRCDREICLVLTSFLTPYPVPDNFCKKKIPDPRYPTPTYDLLNV